MSQRIKLDNLTLLSIDMKTKVVQHVSRKLENFTGSQYLSDFQTFFKNKNVSDNVVSWKATGHNVSHNLSDNARWSAGRLLRR